MALQSNNKIKNYITTTTNDNTKCLHSNGSQNNGDFFALFALLLISSKLYRFHCSSFCMQTLNGLTIYVYSIFNVHINRSIYTLHIAIAMNRSFGVIFVPCLDISHYCSAFIILSEHFFSTFFYLSFVSFFYFAVDFVIFFFLRFILRFHLTKRQRDRLKSSVCNLAYS